jgi:predicted aspartyl protease
VRALLIAAAYATQAHSNPAARDDCRFPRSTAAAGEYAYATPTSLDHIGRIVAPVTVNGQGPFRFVVDTGASSSVISPALAQQLNLSTSPAESMTLSGVTGSALVATVDVDELSAGAIEMRHLTLPVLDSVLDGADGVLGVEGFEDKMIRIDFARDRLTITESRGRPAEDGFQVAPAHFYFGRLLVVDVLVGHVWAKAVIDTGAQRTLGNEALREALRARARKSVATEATEVIGATPERQRGDLSRAPPIKIGSVTIDYVEITFGDIYVFKRWDLDRAPALLIGMDVLGVLDTLAIDYRRREIQIRLRTSDTAQNWTVADRNHLCG